MKTLILFAHPAFHKSRVNRLMVEGLSDIPDVTFHDLYQEYPEFDIDIKREQALLQEHDVIVFQFPLFWYSTPAILKEWQDLVLQHGWAFGSEGNALKDKFFLCSLTVGGPRSAYQVDGFHSHTLNQLLSPLKQTAVLCKMKPLPPFAVYGSHGIKLQEIEDYKANYLTLIDLISNNTFEEDVAMQHECMNDYLAQKLTPHGR